MAAQHRAHRAAWSAPVDPVPAAAIESTRATTPVTATIRGEDGGVMANSAITPDGIALAPWRGPIAYDVRTMTIDGVTVRDTSDVDSGMPPAVHRERAARHRVAAHPDGLYAAVARAANTDPAALRHGVVTTAANGDGVARAVAEFTVARPMRRGHLYGALVESLNWRFRDSAENARAGNAGDLPGRLLANHPGANLVIHQCGAPTVLTPLGGSGRALGGSGTRRRERSGHLPIPLGRLGWTVRNGLLGNGALRNADHSPE